MRHVCPARQAAPHRPQCALLFVVFVSQPFANTPSQSPQFSEHDGVHALATHLADPCRKPDGAEQSAPHAPQLALLFVVFVSQPFAASPSQSA